MPIAALLPLIIQLAPTLASWLFGPSAGTVAAKVGDAVQAVTGTSDPTAALAHLQANPDAINALQVQLAQIAADHDTAQRAADQAALAAQLADVASARAQTVSLAQAHSSVQWAAPVVSVVVLASFGLALYLVLTKALPAGSESTANLILGSLAAMATSVVAFWVGSSAGSQRKDAMLYNSTPTPPAT